MKITFSQLSEQPLDKLRDWCHQNVSSDVQYDGSEAEQYVKYRLLAQDYLEHFLTNHETLDGLTGLQYASYRGYDHYILSLTDLSPEIVNQVSAAGMTPLHLAAAGGHPIIVDFLLKHGADASQPNMKNQLPMFSALQIPYSHDQSLISKKESIFKTLNRAAPGFLTHQDSSGETVIHLMAKGGFTALLADAIKENPSVVFLSTFNQLYPIHNAILNKQIETANLLMKIPDVANLTDRKGSLLHVALDTLDLKLIGLIADKTNINQPNDNGQNPLAYFVETHSDAPVFEQIQQLLLDKGAVPDLVNNM